MRVGAAAATLSPEGTERLRAGRIVESDCTWASGFPQLAIPVGSSVARINNTYLLFKSI